MDRASKENIGKLRIHRGHPCEFLAWLVLVLGLIGIAYKVYEPCMTELLMICTSCNCIGDVAAIVASAQWLKVTGL